MLGPHCPSPSGSVTRYPALTSGQVVSWLARYKLPFTPGTQYSYSNSNYYLLGLAVQRVTGESYNGYLEKRIIAPLGLSHTGPCPAQMSPPSDAIGYLLVGSQAMAVTGSYAFDSEVFAGRGTVLDRRRPGRVGQRPSPRSGRLSQHVQGDDHAALAPGCASRFLRLRSGNGCGCRPAVRRPQRGDVRLHVRAIPRRRVGPQRSDMYGCLRGLGFDGRIGLWGRPCRSPARSWPWLTERERPRNLSCSMGTPQNSKYRSQRRRPSTARHYSKFSAFCSGCAPCNPAPVNCTELGGSSWCQTSAAKP